MVNIGIFDKKSLSVYTLICFVLQNLKPTQ